MQVLSHLGPQVRRPGERHRRETLGTELRGDGETETEGA